MNSRTFKLKIRLSPIIHRGGDVSYEVARVLRALADEGEKRMITPDADQELWALQDSRNTPIGWAKTYPED